jgi:hypothetical protein
MSELINEAAVQRRRLDEIDALSDERPDGPGLGAVAVVGVTATDGAYPVSANSMFRIDAELVVCSEKEGAEASFSGLGSRVYAANIGTGVPPLGTKVVAWLVDGGRLVFQFD